MHNIDHNPSSMNNIEEHEYGVQIQNGTKQASFRQNFEKYYDRLSCWMILSMFFCSPFVFLFMCITSPLWIFALIYLWWMYYDRETPHEGGRRQMWLRKSRFWRCSRDYFPIKLVKTAELPPDTTYLFASFPHGFLSIGALINFLTDVNNFDEAFPGLNVYLCSLSTYFKVPFIRDLLLFLCVCVCSPRGILHELNGPAGNVGVVVVGGMAEMIVSRPSTNRLILKNRKGFVKLALKAGSSLVPVYTFGEPNTYDQPFNGKWYKWLQKIRSPQSAGFALFSGPCEPGYLFGLLPYQTPLTTVVGKPIKLPKVENPTNGMVDEYHTKFVQELTKLFEKYKIKYDPQGENAILSIE